MIAHGWVPMKTLRSRPKKNAHRKAVTPIVQRHGGRIVGKAVDIKQVGEELGVRYIFQQSPNNLLA